MSRLQKINRRPECLIPFMQPHKNTDGEGPNTVAEPYLTDKRPYESLLDSKSGAALNQVLDELMNLV